MEKLVDSIKSKTSQSFFSRRSFNKILKIIYATIEPVISDPRFWKILSQFEKPVESDLTTPNEVQSTDILGLVENTPGKPDKKTQSKGLSIFADALVIPQPRRSSVPPRSRLIMAQTSSNGLTPSGVSVNHDSFSKNIQ